MYSLSSSTGWLAPHVSRPSEGGYASDQVERVEPLVGLGNVLLFSGASGLASPGEFKVGVESPVSGKLHTSTNAVGRPQVCAPDSSIGGVAACPD